MFSLESKEYFSYERPKNVVSLFFIFVWFSEQDYLKENVPRNMCILQAQVKQY